MHLESLNLTLDLQTSKRDEWEGVCQAHKDVKFVKESREPAHGRLKPSYTRATNPLAVGHKLEFLRVHRTHTASGAPTSGCSQPTTCPSGSTSSARSQQLSHFTRWLMLHRTHHRTHRQTTWRVQCSVRSQSNKVPERYFRDRTRPVEGDRMHPSVRSILHFFCEIFLWPARFLAHDWTHLQ
jgi:hypothetical protein